MTTAKYRRIDTLDWLRGFAALSIMFYHLAYWLGFHVDADTLLGRLGIYGVSVFFVLSGLSMAIVYSNNLNGINNILDFYVRRIFRIWPLLWIAILLSILPQIYSYNWKFLFLNFTTLFGFLKPTAYIPVGAWSIGNEMVYYALTPFIFYCFNYRLWLGNVFFVLTVFLGLYIAWFVMSPTLPLSAQWAVYVNPFNNFFFYVLGVTVYYNFRETRINAGLNFIILLTSVLLFAFLPFSADTVSLVTGEGRVVFSVLAFAIVFSFYKLSPSIGKSFSGPLESLGMATYGVYILHPLVFKYLKELFLYLNMRTAILHFFITSIVTIFVAVLGCKRFELKFIKLGKKIGGKLRSGRVAGSFVGILQKIK